MPAFPGAEGFAANITGGRGTDPKIYIVDTLADSGGTGLVDAGRRIYRGSLRMAVEASGPRFVIFEIGGTCTLTTATPGWSFIGKPVIAYTNPGLTILGQTAPGGGFTVKGQFRITEGNLIVRHLRVRGSDDYVQNDHDPLFCFNNTSPYASQVYLDHVTTSWGKDNIAGNGGFSDVTYDSCLIGPQLQDPGPGRGPYIGLPTVSTGRWTFIRNMIYSVAERMPWIQYGDVELINNIFATNNEYTRTMLSGWYQSMRVNVIGNSSLVFSPDSLTANPYTVFGDGFGTTPPSSNTPQYSTTSSMYFNDNYDPTYRPTGAESQTAGVEFRAGVGGGPYPAVVGSPLPMSGSYYIAPTIVSNSAARTAILAAGGLGASRVRGSDGNFTNFRDSLDTTICANPDRGMRYPLSTWPQTIAHCGGLPTIDSGLPLGGGFTSTDGSGIPDSFTRDGAEWYTIGADGYTNLERWVNESSASGPDPNAPVIDRGAATRIVQVAVKIRLTGVSASDPNNNMTAAVVDGGSNVTIKIASGFTGALDN